jgi:DNA repair protein RecO (recombination protein O)
MPLVATDALVLHMFDYLETSRILRLATREYGVQSVVARGARKASRRFGSALDLFAEGVAQLDLRPGRDLHTLTGFEVTQGRPGLASDLTRFTAAAAISECVQRVVTEDHAPAAYDITRAALDALADAPDHAVLSIAVGALWRLVAELGFAPVLDACASCHEAIGPALAVPFSHAAGGVLCEPCSVRAPGARRLPATAHGALRAWMAGGSPVLTSGEGRAHQRLLREFLGEHLMDARALKAYAVWEADRWE